MRCVFLVLVYVSRFTMTGEAARMDAVYAEKYRKKKKNEGSMRADS